MIPLVSNALRLTPDKGSYWIVNVKTRQRIFHSEDEKAFRKMG